MPATAPALLDPAALAHRLAELAGDERAVQVEFLLHLGEFDRREAWLAAGYGSIWDYCRRVLHLREGAAWRRIQAMRALRRLPDLAAPLRDGRICLTTVALLDPVLTEANAAELVARAAYKSKAEVEALVVAPHRTQGRRAPVARAARGHGRCVPGAPVARARRPARGAELAAGARVAPGAGGRGARASPHGRDPPHGAPGGGGHLVAPGDRRRRLQAGARPAHRAPLAQGARR
jgi:hypothetical protein